MNIPSFLRYFLLLAVLPFYSCRDKPENDPTPKTISHHVTVQIIGQNLLPELRPVVSITKTQRLPGTLTATVVAVRENLRGNIDTTYVVGTKQTTDSLNTESVMVSTYLLGCGGATGAAPPAGSVLTATILVDGKKTSSVTLDRAQKGPNVYNDHVLSGSLFQNLSQL